MKVPQFILTVQAVAHSIVTNPLGNFSHILFYELNPEVKLAMCPTN